LLFFALHQLPDFLERLIKSTARNMGIRGFDLFARTRKAFTQILEETETTTAAMLLPRLLFQL